jgi:hypothetical protein
VDGRKHPLIIEESIEIEAPLPVVWEVFSRLEEWGDWNSVCQSCCLIQGKGMQAGVCFEFTLRPYCVPLKITPKITRCVPGCEVVWEGGKLGIRARHRFTFQEKGSEGVVVISREEFAGPLLWLCRLLLVPSRLHRLSLKLLEEIKMRAEICAARVPVAGEADG